MNHDDSLNNIESKTELDSHANMAVNEKNSTILEDSSRTARVNAFSPEYNTLDKVKS